jgi:hypothetical protein
VHWYRLVQVAAQTRRRVLGDGGFDPWGRRMRQDKNDTTPAAASIPHSLTPIKSH